VKVSGRSARNCHQSRLRRLRGQSREYLRREDTQAVDKAFSEIRGQLIGEADGGVGIRSNEG
jgi:hypothetical protein